MILLSAICLATLFYNNNAYSQNTDPIVGVWIGTVQQPGIDPFSARYSFISATRGASNYPSSKCGGVLTRVSSGQGYQFREVINYGRFGDNNPEGCIDGTMTLTLNGEVLDMQWSTIHDGETITATARFQRLKN